MIAMDDMIARSESGYAKVGYVSSANKSAAVDESEFGKPKSVKAVPVSDTE